MNKLILIALLTLFAAHVNGQFLITLSMDVADGVEDFPRVQAGDIVLMQGGQRGPLILRNFTGSPGNPIVVTILPDSPVRISGEWAYGISIRNCSYIHLTGRRSDDTPGILVHDLETENSVGISIGDRSSDIDLSYIEINGTGFAGILAKTDPICGDSGTQRDGFVQYNTHIHHCLIENTGGEGMYVGSTAYHGREVGTCDWVYPPILQGVHIYNNVVKHTAWDGIQISSAISDVQIYNNRLIECASAKLPNQNGGIVIGGGTKADCYNNWIQDCHGSGILVFGQGGTRLFNNVIIRPALQYEPENQSHREHGIFIEDKTKENMSPIGIFSNTIIDPKSDCLRIGALVEQEVRVYNNFFINPGAYEHYENDNTSRTGADAFLYHTNPESPVDLAANISLRYAEIARFVNAEQDDYHLQAVSPYVDLGRSLSDQPGVSFDFDGGIRPHGDGYDVGAFEYGTGTGITEWEQSDHNLPVMKVKQGAASELVLLINTEQDQQVEVLLTNALGQVVSINTLNLRAGQLNELNYYSLPDGMYVVRLFASRRTVSKKLLVY